MQLRIEHSGAVVVLKCSGRMVAGNGLKTLHRMATAQHASQLIVDLAEVPVVDAAGLGKLLHIREWCAAQGICLTLVHPTSHVREVLAVTALDSVLAVRSPEDEAEPDLLLRQYVCAES